MWDIFGKYNTHLHLLKQKISLRNKPSTKSCFNDFTIISLQTQKQNDVIYFNQILLMKSTFTPNMF